MPYSLGEAARHKVYVAYLPEQAASKLVATLHTIISRHAPPANDPQQVLEMLAQRMLVQLAHSQAEGAQLQRQADQLRSALAQWDGTGSSQGADFWRAGMEATQERQQAILREILERLERGAAGVDCCRLPHATVTRYRCLHLQEQLAANGIPATVEEWYDLDRIDARHPLPERALVIQRVAFTPALGELIDRMHAAGRPVIFDVDDLVFEPQLAAWHRGAANLAPSEQAAVCRGRAPLPGHARTLRPCAYGLTACWQNWRSGMGWRRTCTATPWAER